jgi:hypothetical protein
VAEGEGAGIKAGAGRPFLSLPSIFLRVCSFGFACIIFVKSIRKVVDPSFELAEAPEVFPLPPPLIFTWAMPET